MDSIPDSAVGFLLGSLKELVVHYSDLISGTKDKVDALCSHLDTLRGFIDECTEKYKKKKKENKFLLGLVNEVRKVVFQAEDAIETYIVTASVQKDRGILRKAGHVLGYVSDLQDVADQIENVSLQVKDFYDSKAKLSLDVIHDDEIHNEDTQNSKALLVEENNIMVGFEDEVDKLIKLLEKESEKLEVISIVGMPGLGKTTLAIQVKNHPKIKFRFPTRAFISVSQEYKRRGVFLNILDSLNPTHEEMNDKSDQYMVDAIRKELANEQYLIIMDDVWTPEAWEDLKGAFPDSKDSRVLITSRNTSVAYYANPSDDPFSLRLLNEEEGRELLRRKVFGVNSCPQRLEKYEKEIASNCGGLPLSILVIAGILLVNRESTARWKNVAKRVNVYVAKKEEQSNLIGLSYNNLPKHLKLCFLYLGIFHEDSKIPVWKLLRLWIAEGFIEQEEDSRLEDTAEDYLEDLVARNLVIAMERRANGQIKTCRLHDAVRDFCKMEAKRQNFFREIKMLGEAASSSTPNDYYRRVCINSYVKEYIFTNPSNKCVRSLLSFSKEEVTTIPEALASSFHKGFKLLRVLDARSIIFRHFPDELLCLVLLRYIAISCDSNTLPEKVSNLRSLQTAIIKKSQGPLEIKADIWKMSQLRHLHTNVSTRLSCPPAESQKGECFMISPNLQTLCRISPESCRLDVLKRAPNIKKLGICGKLEVSLFDSLSSLECVENLKLFHEDSQMCALPETRNFPERLTKLTLQNTSLDWKYMSILGKLENLEVLKLKENAFVGKRWETVDGGFGRLEVLHIGKTNLVEWEATASNFPMLRCLIIMNCNRLREIPSGIGRISSLQSINLSHTNRRVAFSALNIQRLKIQMHNKSKASKTLAFQLSVLPAEHLDSESTTDDEQSDEITEENEPREEAPQEIRISADANAPRRLPLHKRIWHKLSKGSSGQNPKSKKKGL